MAQTIFFLSRLKPGIDPAHYEAWVEAVDYPRVRTIDAILDYAVLRIEGGLSGERPPFDYVERVVVTSVEEYERERRGKPGREAFLEQLYGYVEFSHAFVASTIGAGAKP